MKRITLFLFMACAISTLFAQLAKTKTLKKVIELNMPGDGGSNGSSVTYNPVTKKYYTAMAGNAIYPFAIFDLKGKLLSNDDLETGYDLRGIWYNPKTKAIEANCYDSGGWVRYTLDNKGMIDKSEVTIEGMNQPNDQSLAFYSAKDNKVYFLNEEGVVVYTMDGKLEKSFKLKYKFKEDPISFVDNENFNTTTVIVTDIPKQELGLLEIKSHGIEFFDKATGFKTLSVYIPNAVPLQDRFNFSYCNGIFWFFDKDNRKWLGYK